MTQNSSEPTYGNIALDYAKAKIVMSITTEMESKYRITACEKEPWTVEFIEALAPGTWFVDVGANVGPYTLIAVAHGLQVVAIEPSMDSAHKLCENLRLNDWADRAIVYAGALSDRTGFDYFSLADLRPGYNDHVFGQHKHQLTHRTDIFHTHIIPTMTLDDLMPRLIGDGPVAMKVDVDGGENTIFDGATRALQDGRLRWIMLELSKKHADAILAKLTGFGWKEVRRIDESVNIGGERPKYGHDRFKDMFYIQMER